MWGILDVEGGFVGECRGVTLHKWNPNEVCSVEDVWLSLPARPGHFDHEARDHVFSMAG